MSELLAIQHHRNGICGAPFHVVLFRSELEIMLGIVFDAEYHVAVLSLDKLRKYDIAFGSNSYRGDCFEPFLRQAIVHSDTLDPSSSPLNQ